MGLKDGMPMVSRALVDLGILERPLPLKNEAPRFGKWIETADVAPDWVDYCNRWYATTPASLRTTKPLYYRMLRIGRWVTAFHPEMASPLDWTREMAAECVAEISRMKVGEWITVTAIQVPKRGLALPPPSKGALLAAMSAFFQDGQEWGWFPRRCFALPRAIKALIGPQPRVIQDDVWAKLVWAGLHLTAEDLPQTGAPYPLEMVRAMAITWLFAGLRSDEFSILPRPRGTPFSEKISSMPRSTATCSICLLVKSLP